MLQLVLQYSQAPQSKALIAPAAYRTAGKFEGIADGVSVAKLTFSMLDNGPGYPAMKYPKRDLLFLH